MLRETRINPIVMRSNSIHICRESLAFLLLGILSLLAIQPLEASDPALDARDPDKVKLTYIANEGFMIEFGQKSILVDAIFGERALNFCSVPTRETLAQITSATGAFSHVDHFHARLTAEHLRSNKNGKFISCAQSVEALSGQEGFDSFRDRVIEITPDSLYYQDTKINGIGVRVYRLAHGPYLETDPETGRTVNRHRNVQNLGFVFELNGVKVFHCGDSSPRCWDDYEHFRLDREGIDIALLGRGFLASDVGLGIDIIRDYIKPRHIVLMHIHPDANAYYMNVAEQVKEEFPSVTIFESLMESKVFSIP